ncbi:CRISPR-associated helicase, Cas3 family [Desulfonauticus submarinus]|uniref:CRISPR-associated helicase, Cas3 family n=1 Tax=Desulfonauticus submarinus TaxID=206665 RepID=A0A1H0DPI8_9BACT|nr:CRISPR-associated helicase/endonuclease Cas3 [Desulfonauticus submarinus]SDN71988.1 CRISPR-associated helicase, Cas3 family [Desulfonauticus submarinus]
MNCLSHPNKNLITHLSNVKKIGLTLFGNKDKVVFGLPDNLEKVLEIALFYHDFGKSTKFFQDYLNASIINEKYEGNSELTQHALISACLAAYKISNTLEKIDNSLLFSLLVFLAIRKHHGNFENLDEMLVISETKWRSLEEQWNNVLEEFKKEIDNIPFEDLKDFIEDLLWDKDSEIGKLDNYFLLNFLFSILIYSDKTEVVLGPKIDTVKFPDKIFNSVNNYKNQIFKNSEKTELNRLREDAYNISLVNLLKQHKNGNIFSLNLPTGAGKTLTVLNLAFNLLKNDKSLQRIIYALPFTSIVDQTEKVLKDIFNKNGLNSDDYLIVHHHLAEAKIKLDENYIEGDKAEFLIENWDKPFVLTTFWQLFNSIITNKNSQLRKFHNLANSIIILDEVQTIPYKYWILTNEVFKKMCEIFNIKIIFLTATMPLIFSEEKNEIIPLIPKDKRSEYFSKFSRYRIEIVNHLNEINIDELFEIAKKDIKKNINKSFLFVFNTINTSIEFYNKIKSEFSDKKLIYLSSNILPIERQKRIAKIKNNSKDKIIVSTQVIEAGVDIDLDIVYRDFAPLDSIIQSSGRCNRNSKKEIGVVKVFKLRNCRGKYDYSYIYSGLSVNATDLVFKNKDKVDESKVLELINEYYCKIKENSSTNFSNEILIAMKNLNYEEVSNKFKLIDEIPSFSMFFEIDERAKKLLKIFKEIMNINDRYERKSEFLKIKSDFYRYVLSVKLSEKTKSYHSSFDAIGELRIVSKDLCESVYDVDTGLKYEWSVFL